MAELTGYIYEVTGNQMPAIGRPQSKGRPVTCTLYVFEPTVRSQTQGKSPLFDKVNTKLIATATSNNEGRYAVKLKPGMYSVFISSGTKYFAAESDGNGYLNPVNIKQKQLNSKNFTLNYNAAY